MGYTDSLSAGTKRPGKGSHSITSSRIRNAVILSLLKNRIANEQLDWLKPVLKTKGREISTEDICCLFILTKCRTISPWCPSKDYCIYI